MIKNNFLGRSRRIATAVGSRLGGKPSSNGQICKREI